MTPPSQPLPPNKSVSFSEEVHASSPPPPSSPAPAFKLPIEYCADDKLHQLSPLLMKDLELVQCRPENESGQSLFGTILAPSHPLEHDVMERIATHYTTDISFLSDHAKLLAADVRAFTCDAPALVPNYSIYDEWMEWKKMSHEAFANTYLFMDGGWLPEKMVEPLQPHIARFNSSPIAQQCMHIYNLASPFLSILIIFLLMVIVPLVSLFFIQSQSGGFSWNAYIQQVANGFRAGPPFFRIFTDFASANWKERLYLFGMFIFYMFSLYGNTMVCITSYRNCARIYSHLRTHCAFLKEQTIRLAQFCRQSVETTAHDAWNRFRETAESHIETLAQYESEIDRVLADASSLSSSMPSSSDDQETFKEKWVRTTLAGPPMAMFYRIVHDDAYAASFRYACSFQAWTALLSRVSAQIGAARLNPMTWRRPIPGKRPTLQMTRMEFPPLMDSATSSASSTQQIKNNCLLRKNMLLTGTNASGKTTYMKTIIFNAIMAQQWGVGAFQKGKMTPFAHFHCYLSVPDTSGRDSLFQAEARRCKNMLDAIDANGSQNHLCIFDELFSGTNPGEAVISAEGFLRYIANHRNVRFLVSTHFVQLCKHLKSHPTMQNRHMKRYQLKKGIGYEQGGIDVLRQLQYPLTIIEWASRLQQTPVRAT